MAPSASEKGNRAILTEREQEILRGEADVSDNYYYRVVSGVRGKIKRLEHDLETLDENHPKLANELRESVCVNSPLMDELVDGEWSLEQKSSHSILLTSGRGDITINRKKEDSAEQIWFIDAEIEGQDPKSWKIRAKNRYELFARTIPDMLAEVSPNQTNKEN